MERPELTFKIALFGSLLEELNHWSSESDVELAEVKFDETLVAVKAMRKVILEEIETYERNCKVTGEPFFLSYRGVKNELQKSTFES